MSNISTNPASKLRPIGKKLGKAKLNAVHNILQALKAVAHTPSKHKGGNQSARQPKSKESYRRIYGWLT
jgi:hypothetical protein